MKHVSIMADRRLRWRLALGRATHRRRLFRETTRDLFHVVINVRMRSPKRSIGSWLLMLLPLLPPLLPPRKECNILPPHTSLQQRCKSNDSQRNVETITIVMHEVNEYNIDASTR